jgi:hypothetical protein
MIDSITGLCEKNYFDIEFTWQKKKRNNNIETQLITYFSLSVTEFMKRVNGHTWESMYDIVIWN